MAANSRISLSGQCQMVRHMDELRDHLAGGKPVGRTKPALSRLVDEKARCLDGLYPCQHLQADT
jgi:hypothetical protein